ncbi:MAG: hypothetical protein LBH47_02535 [Christensenellaceae bacterium]|nr:hypothetical protein [Christensenellaceae bacterium]
MTNTVLNYINSLIDKNVSLNLITPEFVGPIDTALSNANNDGEFVKFLLNNTNFNIELINVEFLAAIITSSYFAEIAADNNCKQKIFSIYGNVLKNLKNENADFVVMNANNIKTIIRQCNNDEQKEMFQKILENKIIEVKNFAENIKNKNDLLNFNAIKYNETDSNLNYFNVCENFKRIFGENGEVLVMAFENMEKNFTNIDGMVMAFDAKIMALQKAYEIDNEALNNFMVQFKAVI